MIGVEVAGDLIVDCVQAELLEIRPWPVAIVFRPVVKKNGLPQWADQDSSIALPHVDKVDLKFSVGGLPEKKRCGEGK
jgi:hypothetical protein